MKKILEKTNKYGRYKTHSLISPQLVFLSFALIWFFAAFCNLSISFYDLCLFLIMAWMVVKC